MVLPSFNGKCLTSCHIRSVNAFTSPAFSVGSAAASLLLTAIRKTYTWNRCSSAPFWRIALW